MDAEVFGYALIPAVHWGHQWAPSLDQSAGFDHGHPLQGAPLLMQDHQVRSEFYSESMSSSVEAVNPNIGNVQEFVWSSSAASSMAQAQGQGGWEQGGPQFGFTYSQYANRGDGSMFYEYVEAGSPSFSAAGSSSLWTSASYSSFEQSAPMVQSTQNPTVPPGQWSDGSWTEYAGGYKWGGAYGPVEGQNRYEGDGYCYQGGPRDPQPTHNTAMNVNPQPNEDTLMVLPRAKYYRLKAKVRKMARKQRRLADFAAQLHGYVTPEKLTWMARLYPRFWDNPVMSMLAHKSASQFKLKQLYDETLSFLGGLVCNYNSAVNIMKDDAAGLAFGWGSDVWLGCLVDELQNGLEHLKNAAG